MGRLVGLLALFAGSMVGLVLADDLLVLYTCWELTRVTSYLLIGNEHANARPGPRPSRRCWSPGAGGLAMLIGIVAIGQAAGTFQLSAILESPPSGPTVTAGLVLVLLGATTKSAQYPFHPGFRGHGGAGAGQRLPALGHDGEGRHLPRGPAGPRLRPTVGFGARP